MLFKGKHLTKGKHSFVVKLFCKETKHVKIISIYIFQDEAITSKNHSNISLDPDSPIEQLWKKINLRGCLPILEDMYFVRLVKGYVLLGLELLICGIILFELTIVGLAFSFLCGNHNDEEKYEESIHQSIDSFHHPMMKRTTSVMYRPTNRVQTLNL